MIDTTNKFYVGVQGDKIRVLAFGRSLTVDEAMNLAAWLVVSAEMLQLTNGAGAVGIDETTEFDAWLNAVRHT